LVVSFTTIGLSANILGGPLGRFLIVPRHRVKPTLVPLLAILVARTVACLTLIARVLPAARQQLQRRGVDLGLLRVAMGATPTTIPVMTAITRAHVASLRWLVSVPFNGAFFVDIANAITIQTIVGLMGR